VEWPPWTTTSRVIGTHQQQVTSRQRQQKRKPADQNNGATQRQSRHQLLQKLHEKIHTLRNTPHSSSPDKEDVKSKKRQRSADKSRESSKRRKTKKVTSEETCDVDKNSGANICDSGANICDSGANICDDGLEFGRLEFEEKKVERPNYNEAVANRGAKARRIREGIRSIEAEQRHLDKLPEEQRNDAHIDLLMKKATDKAAGLRVLDNLKKLRSRQKSVVSRKKSSKRKWSERLKDLESKQEASAQRKKDSVEERKKKKRTAKGTDFFRLTTNTTNGVLKAEPSRRRNKQN